MPIDDLYCCMMSEKLCESLMWRPANLFFSLRRCICCDWALNSNLLLPLTAETWRDVNACICDIFESRSCLLEFPRTISNLFLVMRSSACNKSARFFSDATLLFSSPTSFAFIFQTSRVLCILSIFCFAVSVAGKQSARRRAIRGCRRQRLFPDTAEERPRTRWECLDDAVKGGGGCGLWSVESTREPEHEWLGQLKKKIFF